MAGSIARGFLFAFLAVLFGAATGCGRQQEAAAPASEAVATADSASEQASAPSVAPEAAPAPPTQPPPYPADTTENAQTGAPGGTTEPAPPPPAQMARSNTAPPTAVTDDRVIECARTGTWGLGDCPSREQLVAHMSQAGTIAFTNPPTQMNLGDSYIIHVATGVGEEMAASAVREAAGSDASVTEQSAALLPSLEAELTGVGFDIRPLQSGARQTLLSDRPNEWSWEVRPRQEGVRRLTLTVWGLLTFGDERFPPIRVETLRHDVNITVNLPTRLRLASAWATDHWEAAAGAGAAFLAFFTWMMARLRRRPSA